MTKSLNNLSARDVMTTPAAYVMDQTPIQEVARLLLREGISAAPVLNEGGHLVGIVSEGDLVRRRSGLSKTVAPGGSTCSRPILAIINNS
jgi:CBS domain-containing protein